MEPIFSLVGLGCFMPMLDLLLDSQMEILSKVYLGLKFLTELNMVLILLPPSGTEVPLLHGKYICANFEQFYQNT